MDDPKIKLENIVPIGNYWYGMNSLGVYMPGIYKYHFDHDKPLIAKTVSGGLKTDEKELLSALESLGGKRKISNFDREYLYVWEGNLIQVSLPSEKKEIKKTIEVTGYMTDEKLIEFFDSIESKFITKDISSMIFTIVKTMDSFDVRNMGDGGSSPLIRDNYNPEVTDDLDFVVKVFNRAPPPSRIVIFNGEPGTGKTHLIRSILSQIDNVFIILPANMISSLDKPEFIPFLLKVKSQYEKPIILVIEDGDSCLVPRKTDNISAISSLLNLSDGILGSLIDIKVIITTNANIKDIDAAICRPGRLCKNITVNPLPYDRANAIYRRLMNDEKVSLEKRKMYTLAEVYCRFNNKDLPDPVVKKYHTIGFDVHQLPPMEQAILNINQKDG